MRKSKLTSRVITFILAFAIFSQQAFAIGASPLRIMIQANPGNSVEGYINAQNTKDEPILANLTKGDFLVNENQSLQFMYEPQEGNVHSLLTWIEFTENDVEVGPNETKKITYKINIPNDAPSGSYYGVVFIQGKDPNSAGVQGSGMGISTNVAQLILLEIKGNLYRDTTLNSFQIIRNERDETPTNTTFTTNVFNSGNTYDALTGKITITDKDKNLIQELDFNRDISSVMPQRQKTYVENWSFADYKNGIYFANLTAKNKDDKSYAEEIKFKISTDRKTGDKVLSIMDSNPKDANLQYQIIVIFGLLLLLVIIIRQIIKCKKSGKRKKKRFFGLFTIFTLMLGMFILPASAQDADIIIVNATVDVGLYAEFELYGCWDEPVAAEWEFVLGDDIATLNQPGDRETGLGDNGDQYGWYDTHGDTPNGILYPTATGAFGYDDCKFIVTAENWSNWNITLYSDAFDDGFGNQIWDMIGYSTNGFDFTLENEASGYPATQGEHGFFIVDKSLGMVAAAEDDGTAAGASYTNPKDFDETTCGSSSNRPCYHFIPSSGSPQTIFSSSSNVTDQAFVIRFGVGADFSFPAGTYEATATLTLNTTP